MFDPIQWAAVSVAHRGALAPALVFGAGIASCFGPCVAPRFLAVVSCAGFEREHMRAAVALFVAGLVSAYALFGAVASLVGSIVDFSAWVFGAAGLGMIAAGMWSVVRAQPVTCTHDTEGRVALSYGGTFLLGASFAFVVAPCCTPLVAAIVAYTSALGDILYGSSLLALFGLGHALPVALLGLGAGALAERLRRIALHQATAVTSGCLLVLLGAFYTCLA